jgi:hypothetical protein
VADGEDGALAEDQRGRGEQPHELRVGELPVLLAEVLVAGVGGLVAALVGDAVGQDNETAHAPLLRSDASEETLLGTPTPVLLAGAPPARVDMTVGTGRNLDAPREPKRPRESLPTRMMGRARRSEVVEIERKPGSLVARDDVVDVQDARTVAAKQARNRTAITVAGECLFANGPPGGRGEEGVLVH